MERRKFLIGAGSLAAGGAAALGSGAFTSVQADRSVDVTVAGDANAFLGLEPSSGANGNYATTEDGKLAIQLDGSDNTPEGNGVNNNAETIIKDVFRMRNQGTQRVYVYIEDTSDQVTFKLSRATSEKWINDSPVSTLTPNEVVDVEGSENAILIDPGLEVMIHMYIDTTGESTPDTLLDGDITIQAKADPPADSPFGDS
jgi:hypothetical protein